MSHRKLPTVALPAMTLAALATLAAAAGDPASPATGLSEVAADAAALHARLTPEQAEMVDVRGLVVTFDEQVSRGADARLLAVSVGTLHHAPSVVQGLLADIGGYETWLLLQPSYKGVRSRGAQGFVADIGSAHARSTRYALSYDVTTAGRTTAWTVSSPGSPFHPGSFLSYEAAPHPKIPGATLLVHRQLTILPPKGRMTKYLTKVNDAGDMKYWQDASKHARRIHCAIAAALEQPPGAERRLSYIAHYQREFGAGALPLWAE